MTEVEIERMVVNLVGNATSFVTMLKDGVVSSTAAADAVEQNARRIQGFTDSLTGYAYAASSALASLGASNYLKEAFYGFEGREAGILKLNAAIEANGRDVAETTAQYRKFAKEVANVTTTSAGSTLAMLQQAESFGITGEAAQRAVRNTLGAQAAGVPVSLRAMAMLEQGQTMMLGRMIPGLREIKGESERVAFAQQYLAKQFEVAKSTAGTAVGQLQQLKNAYAGFKSDIGETFAQQLKPVIAGVKSMVQWLRALSPEAKTNIALVLGLVAALLALKPAIAALSFAQGALFNPFVAGIAAATAALIVFIHEMGGIPQAMEQAGSWLQQGTAYFMKLKDSAVEWISEWVSQNKELVLSIALVAGAVVAVIVTFKLLSTVYALVAFAIVTLRVQQIISLGLWVAWTAAVYAAYAVALVFQSGQLVWVAVWVAQKIVMMAGVAVWVLWKTAVTLALLAISAFNTAMAIAYALQGGSSLAMIAWTIAVTVAKVAVWLFNAALTVTNVLLMGAGFIVGAMLVVALGAAFAVAAAAAIAAYESFRMVVDMLLQIPVTYGPIAHVGAMFGEWIAIIQDVVKAAKQDLPLAWELMKAGFRLAISEIRDLWPPLWDFLVQGFNLVWTFTAAKFRREYEITIDKIKVETLALAGESKYTGRERARIAEQEKLNKMLDDASLNAVTGFFKRAAAGFKVIESDETKRARELVDGLRKKVAELRGDEKKEEEHGFDLGAAVGSGISKGIKDSNLQATLFGSAEALARANRQSDMMAGDDVQKGKGVVGKAFNAANARVALDNEVLKEIRDILKNKEPVVVNEGMA